MRCVGAGREHPGGVRTGGQGEEGWLEGGRVLGMVMWRGARGAQGTFPSSRLNPLLLLYFMLLLTPQQMSTDRWLMFSPVLLTAVC